MAQQAQAAVVRQTTTAQQIVVVAQAQAKPLIEQGAAELFMSGLRFNYVSTIFRTNR